MSVSVTARTDEDTIIPLPHTSVRVVSLDIRSARLKLVLPLLQQPAMAYLQRLHLSHSSVVKLADAVEGISLLHSLRHLQIAVVPRSAGPTPDRVLAPLSGLQHLTSLDYQHAGDVAADLLLHHCCPPRLSKLTLRQAKFNANGFRFLATPPFCHIESLTLAGFQAAEPSSGAIPTAEDFAVTFAAMHSLHTLELRGVAGIDTLLAQLRHALSLTAVRIGNVSWRYATAAAPACYQPSLDTLHQLLTACPQLHVQLLLSDLGAFTSESVALSQQPAATPPETGWVFDLLRTFAALSTRVELVHND